MIVIDTSAIVAIIQHEPERLQFLDRIWTANSRYVSAVSYNEAGMVLFSRRGMTGLIDLDQFIAVCAAEIIPHDEHLARLAIGAFQRFGKGIHAQARLNFGDCSAYALATSLNAPLLYKGGDFAATDLTSAL